MANSTTHRLWLIEGVARGHVSVELAQHIVLDLAVHRLLVRLGGVGIHQEQEGDQDGKTRHLRACNLGSD